MLPIFVVFHTRTAFSYRGRRQARQASSLHFHAFIQPNGSGSFGVTISPYLKPYLRLREVLEDELGLKDAPAVRLSWPRPPRRHTLAGLRDSNPNGGVASRLFCSPSPRALHSIEHGRTRRGLHLWDHPRPGSVIAGRSKTRFYLFRFFQSRRAIWGRPTFAPAALQRAWPLRII